MPMDWCLCVYSIPRRNNKMDRDWLGNDYVQPNKVNGT